MEGGGILSAAALFLLGTLQALHAQKNPFLEQIRNFPQEKIHVTTDRDAYIAGDTVWLRAHCVDAATLEPLTASRYVYVELRTCLLYTSEAADPKNDGAARRRAPSTWPSSPKAATSSTDSPAAWGSRPWARTDFRGR